MDDHPDFLRSPEKVCKPDSRTAASGAGCQHRTIEDQYHVVAELRLTKTVPDEIRIQFETTKNLYLYAWFVYRFYPIAEHHAYTCLELALRKRFESELLSSGEKKREFGPGLKRLLSYAVKNGYLKNENFQTWQCRTESNARQRTELEIFKEMDRLGLEEIILDESRIEIKDEDRNHDYLAIILETVPWMRNRYAHGASSLSSQVLGTIRLVSEIINQIY